MTRHRIAFALLSFAIVSCCVAIWAMAVWGLGARHFKPHLGSLPVYGYEVIAAYPHDTDAFTQGLYYRDGYLYESTGLTGHSTVRKVVPETGEVVKIHYMADDYFGEGLTMRGDSIYQLTYRNHAAFTYVELDTFAVVDSLPYPLEGWGLTHDDTSLIASDGSYRLYHLDPQIYEEIRRFNVTAGGELQRYMNEMETIQGRIYANIFMSDMVAIIVPETGIIEGWLDLGGLRDSITTGSVLNGIAWDPDNSRLFVTGKDWSHLFHIRVEPIKYPPEIVWSDPPGTFCAAVDSQVELAVGAVDFNAGDTLSYTWSINGVADPAAGDSFYVYVSPVPAVDTVVVEVSDGMFTDSTSWIAIVSTAGVEEDLEISSGTSPRVQPNPFSLSAEIYFDVPRGPGPTQQVEVAVHDIRGRSVRTLVTSEMEPGEHRITWDATDRNGERVAAGVYFITLSLGGETLSRKAAVLE